MLYIPLYGLDLLHQSASRGIRHVFLLKSLIDEVHGRGRWMNHVVGVPPIVSVSTHAHAHAHTNIAFNPEFAEEALVDPYRSSSIMYSYDGKYDAHVGCSSTIRWIAASNNDFDNELTIIVSRV